MLLVFRFHHIRKFSIIFINHEKNPVIPIFFSKGSYKIDNVAILGQNTRLQLWPDIATTGNFHTLKSITFNLTALRSLHAKNLFGKCTSECCPWIVRNSGRSFELLVHCVLKLFSLDYDYNGGYCTYENLLMISSKWRPLYSLQPQVHQNERS